MADERVIKMRVPSEGALLAVVGRRPMRAGWFAQLNIGPECLTAGPFETEQEAVAECEDLMRRVTAAMREKGVEVDDPEGWTDV